MKIDYTTQDINGLTAFTTLRYALAELNGGYEEISIQKKEIILFSPPH